MSETWGDRIRSRARHAVTNEDLTRELSLEISRDVRAVMEKDISCTGVDGVEVMQVLTGSPDFKELVKQCLREVLQETVK